MSDEYTLAHLRIIGLQWRWREAREQGNHIELARALYLEAARLREANIQDTARDVTVLANIQLHHALERDAYAWRKEVPRGQAA